MRVWRIARAPYAAPNGLGAELYGGRWNSPGRPLVYTAGSAPLAVLETLVHLDPDVVPDDLRLFAIEVPDGLEREVVRAGELPEGWSGPDGHRHCRPIGDRWLARARTPLLVVPSAVVAEGENFLFNPRHPATVLTVVEARPFSFDLRLL
jgi:RES domain-containing protein